MAINLTNDHSIKLNQYTQVSQAPIWYHNIYSIPHSSVPHNVPFQRDEDALFPLTWRRVCCQQVKNFLSFLISAVFTEIICKASQTNALHIRAHNAISCYQLDNHTVRVSLMFKLWPGFLGHLALIVRSRTYTFNGIIELIIVNYKLTGLQRDSQSGEFVEEFNDCAMFGIFSFVQQLPGKSLLCLIHI